MVTRNYGDFITVALWSPSVVTGDEDDFVVPTLVYMYVIIGKQQHHVISPLFGRRCNALRRYIHQ